MLLSRHFVFVHIPKTGGTFIRERLREHAPPDWQVVVRPGHWESVDIPQEYKGLPIVAFVRNPWDFYVAWYQFIKISYEKIIASIPSMQDEATRERALADASPVFYAVSAGGRNDFGTTLRNIMNLDYCRAHDVGGLSGFLAQATGAGLRGIELGAENIKIGRMENLRGDLLAILDSLHVPMTSKLRAAIMQDPPLNVRPRSGRYQDWYNQELQDLVAHKDRALIRRFNYNFD